MWHNYSMNILKLYFGEIIMTFVIRKKILTKLFRMYLQNSLNLKYIDYTKYNLHLIKLMSLFFISNDVKIHKKKTKREVGSLLAQSQVNIGNAHYDIIFAQNQLYFFKFIQNRKTRKYIKFFFTKIHM